jgi:putative RecB family exonuclease
MPTINHSKLETWRTCQMRYKLAYLEAVPETPQPALLLGRAVHQTIDADNQQHQHLGTYLSLDALLASGRALLHAEAQQVDPAGTWVSPGDLAELGIKSDALLTAYFATVQGKYQPLRSEVPFKFRLPLSSEPARSEWYFTGRIDALMLDTDGQVVIVDYKTGKTPWPPDDEHTLDQATAYLFASQMMAYAAHRVIFIPLIWQQQRGHLTATAEFRDTVRTPEQILSYIQNVQDIIHQLEQAAASGLYQPHPGPQCRWCSVRTHCAYRAF